MIVQTTLSDRIISQNIGTSAELNDAHKTIDKLNLEIEGLNSEIELLNKDHLAEIDAINLGYTDRDNELMVIINDINTLL